MNSSRKPNLVRFLTFILIGLTVVTMVGPIDVMAAPSSAADAVFNLAKVPPHFYAPVIGSGISVGPCSSIPDSCPNNWHKGPDLYAIDYLGRLDTPIHPALAGNVIFSGWDKNYGWSVVIRHWDDTKWDHKYYSIYAHLSKKSPIVVGSQGTQVNTSTIIGYMGSTGDGAHGTIHLHFAVRYTDQILWPNKGQIALWGQSMTAFNVRAQR